MVKKTKDQRKQEAEEKARIAEAIDYRLQGISYAEIAEQMKVSEEAAQQYVIKGLGLITHDETKDALRLDLERVNQMMTACYGNAIEGDRDAMHTWVRLRQERTSLEEKIIPPVKGDLSPIKKKGGIPEHVPTPDSNLKVVALKMHGLDNDRIALHLGISTNTLVKHYSYILEYGKADLLAEAAGKLVQHWRNGDRGMLCFFLKTQGGYRETTHVLHGGDGRDGAQGGMLVRIVGGLPDPPEFSMPINPEEAGNGKQNGQSGGFPPGYAGGEMGPPAGEDEKG